MPNRVRAFAHPPHMKSTKTSANRKREMVRNWLDKQRTTRTEAAMNRRNGTHLGRTKTTPRQRATRNGSSSRTETRRPRFSRINAIDLEYAVQRYADLYDFAPVGYVSFDRAGRIEEINLAATKLLGRSRDMLIGCPFALFIAQEDAQLFLDYLWRCRTSEQRVETELRLKNAARQIIYAHLSSTPMTSGRRDGALLYQTAIVDLTERKRVEDALRESEERLRAMLEQATVGIARCDLNGQMTFVNQKFADMLHYDRTELVGRNFASITHPEDLSRNSEMFQQILRDSKPFEIEKRYLRKDGSIQWADVSVAPVRDLSGKPRSTVAIILDISERRGVEQRQEALYSFVQRQHQAKSLREIYSAATDALLAATGCDRASILLFDRTGVMRFVHWRRLSAQYRRAVAGHSPWKIDAKNPKPVAISNIDVADLPVSLKRTIQREGIGAAAFIPLAAEEKLIGKLMIYYNGPHTFSEAELSLALNISRQLAIGMQRHRAEEELRKSKLLLEHRVQKRTEALRAANRELQREIERRKGLEGEILEISDREQQRLGQELHDGLCQQLTAIGFMARATATRVKDHRVVQIEDLDKIAQLINNSVADARNIARDLHKEEVDAASFVEALRSLTEREMWKTRCHLELQTDVHIEDDLTASQLYRILREALINAHKHAKASKVVLEVGRRKDNLVFSVTDNGIGFSRKTRSGKGLGFHIMQYRAHSIGARLKLESPAKGGARIVCYLPQPSGSG